MTSKDAAMLFGLLLTLFLVMKLWLHNDRERAGLDRLCSFGALVSSVAVLVLLLA